jgi:hypothetical protein
MTHRFMSAALVLAILPIVACSRKPARDTDQDAAMDRVSQSPKLDPQRVSHGLSKLDKLQRLAFEVPPHQLTPRLTGSFSSFMQGTGGARVSNESADVELLVMTEDQFDAYTQHRSAESLYAIEPSHDHAVSIALPATQETSVHYYAVFRRANDAKTALWVNTDLTIAFEYAP